VSEFNKKELVECFDGLCLFLANHGFTQRDERAVTIRKILENIWVEGEPGHEEYHIHPRAFEVEKKEARNGEIS